MRQQELELQVEAELEIAELNRKQGEVQEITISSLEHNLRTSRPDRSTETMALLAEREVGCVSYYDVISQQSPNDR